MSPRLIFSTILASYLLASAGASTTERVSIATGGAQGNSYSSESSVSADGRHVAFGSGATNLVQGDTNGAGDVFVRDRATGQTSRISVATGFVQANNYSFWPRISADGRYVAFTSLASNLVQGDANGDFDVFVHDRQTGQTSRVSVPNGGFGEGNGGSFEPSISADGRFVVFSSAASNLVQGDTNGQMDVFVIDRVMNQTTRVSVSSGSVQSNDYSGYASISDDGAVVAFESGATNLVQGDTNGAFDVFVRDLQTRTTRRTSVATGGGQSNGNSRWAAMSGNGRFVVFASLATNLVQGDQNGFRDVFLHDIAANRTSIVSVSTGRLQGNGASGVPALGWDGRWVAFESAASNLVTGDTNGASDVFLHDAATSETKRVSVAAGGGQGNGDSNIEPGGTALSADGGLVVFNSMAANLVQGDTNREFDVFAFESGRAGLPWPRRVAH